jgi:hypothetical protein
MEIDDAAAMVMASAAPISSPAQACCAHARHGEKAVR